MLSPPRRTPWPRMTNMMCGRLNAAQMPTREQPIYTAAKALKNRKRIREEIAKLAHQALLTLGC